MRGWTLPLGRWFGVELRMHTFFVLLAGVCLVYGQATGAGIGRGLVLWLLVVATVAVRETARLLVAAWLGLRLRAILLLPIGGLYAYANPESQETAGQGTGQYALALAGPLANLATGAALAGILLGASGQLQLLGTPLVSPLGLLRTLVWLHVFLGAVHLLPAYPLDMGRLMRGHFSRAKGTGLAGRAAAGVGQLVALGLIVSCALLLNNPWLVFAGFFVLIAAQLEDQGVFFQSVVDTVVMREVMLTDFAMLSPSDTLAGALARCIHTLQDDFPVVRGAELVGIISRQRIVDALRNEGNGYVQAAMSRAFQVARPEDTLGATIRRLSAGRGLTLIPVADEGRVVGIVSLQNLMSSMALLAEQRRVERLGTGA